MSDRPGPDWQVTSFLPNGFLLETDCNSGDQRLMYAVQCRCGEPILTELGAKEYGSITPDGRLIFESCRLPVDGSVLCEACRQKQNTKQKEVKS